MHGGEQLGLTGVSWSEAMVSITEYVVLFQVVLKVLTNDVFKQLAGYRRQWNWSIVLHFAPVTLLRHTRNVCGQPVRWHLSCLYRLTEIENTAQSVNAGAMVSVHSFSILLGMLSGPHALAEFRFQRSFATLLSWCPSQSWVWCRFHLGQLRAIVFSEDRVKLVEKDLGGAVTEESSMFLQGVYPCVVLVFCFHVPPEWPSVVSFILSSITLFTYWYSVFLISLLHSFLKNL